MEVYVAKNRVQPANSLQTKYFVSRAMTGRIGGSPHFSPLHEFCHGLLGFESLQSSLLLPPNILFTNPADENHLARS